MSGIYLHIPFCKQACTYCDFHFSTNFETYRQEMVDAICKEISFSKDFFQRDELVSTIYFGGGTPSILNEREINQIFAALHKTFDLSQLKEVTLEANPDDISIEQLVLWKKSGINRLSIGVQSFRQSDLDWMKRAHNANEAEQSILLAQEYGFLNLTVDLIYGLPKLSIQAWQHHIQKLINFNIPHVSAYCLTVEPKTVLNRLVKTQQISLPNDELQAKQFEFLVETLENSNYEQYEISNFSLPGFHSKHNSNYWRNKKYLGIGPSAHSYDLQNRRWNIANNQLYIRKINALEKYTEIEQLTSENHFNELIMTGLRTKWGVNLVELNELVELDAHFWSLIKKFKQSNDLMHKGNTLFLTKKGLLKADFIASELFL